jgi:hypothetical protein
MRNMVKNKFHSYKYYSPSPKRGNLNGLGLRLMDLDL